KPLGHPSKSCAPGFTVPRGAASTRPPWWRSRRRSRGGGADEGSAGGCAASGVRVAAAAVAHLQRLGPRKLGLRFVEQRLRGLALLLQLFLRADEVVAPLARRLGEGGVGEVVDVGDAGLLLFGGDLEVEFGGHALEVGDHHVELRKLLALLVDLEPLQPHQIFPCLHTRYSRNAERLPAPPARPLPSFSPAPGAVGKQNPNSAPPW